MAGLRAVGAARTGDDADGTRSVRRRGAGEDDDSDDGGGPIETFTIVTTEPNDPSPTSTTGWR